MARVFMLQKPLAGHNTLSLEDFGAPEWIFHRGFYPDDVDLFNDKIVNELDKRLVDFNPDHDFIAPMGDSCVVAAVTVWLLDNDLLPCNFLKYDKKYNGFYSIQIG
tara:strand:+ start:791 stop:1108 length:318 start_codon:yes stop_codon:yes gene_type:complete